MKRKAQTPSTGKWLIKWLVILFTSYFLAQVLSLVLAVVVSTVFMNVGVVGPIGLYSLLIDPTTPYALSIILAFVFTRNRF